MQLAKHLGAKVITTASAGNHDYVRGLGADQVIDYNKEDFTSDRSDLRRGVRYRRRRGARRQLQGAKSGGKLVWISPGPEGVTRADVETLKPDVKRDRAHLERLLELLKVGAVKPPAITHYKLSQAAEAHKVSEGRHLKGKLVFDVR